MTDIHITPMEPGAFGVQVTEGGVTTSHRVKVPDEIVDELDLREVDPTTLVRESIEFLLEREPATSILSEFALDDIARYFSDFYPELQRRVTTA